MQNNILNSVDASTEKNDASHIAVNDAATGADENITPSATKAEPLQSATVDSDKGEDDESDFEQLIKGKYKDAFTKKVQAIIDKRFKETKLAKRNEDDEARQSKDGGDAATKKAVADISDEGLVELTENQKLDADGLTALMDAGIDRQTALKVLHIDEIMEASARYGAQLAAKSIADGLKLKAARPNESALGQIGFTAKRTVANLTPEKRRELATKALMGEKIDF